jgi:hypothetical protein
LVQTANPEKAFKFIFFISAEMRRATARPSPRRIASVKATERCGFKIGINNLEAGIAPLARNGDYL